MLTAIHRVHLKNGPWITNQGYEYNLVLIVAAALLAELGPGPLSVDHLLGTEESGPAWGIAAVAMGGAGAIAVHQLAQPEQPPAPVQQATAGAAAADAPTAPAQPAEPAIAR